MPAAAHYPSDLELPAGDGADRATLLGVSLAGAIYRSQRRPVCYRVLLRDEAFAARRMAAIAAKELPPYQGVAPVVDAEPVPGTGYFSVTYAVALDRSLVDVLADPSLETRLTLMARVVSALVSWWAAVGLGRVPLPSDIVFEASGTPWLLRPLDRRLPGPPAVLSAGERALFLAPELVRGVVPEGPAEQEPLDRFALGVMLQLCLANVRRADPAETLLRAACGTTLGAELQESRLPLWLERSSVMDPLRAAVRSLTSPDPAARSAVDLVEVARAVARVSRGLDPLVQARAIREGGAAAQGGALAQGVSRVQTAVGARGNAEAALALLQDALLEEERYDLLLEAGEIAGADLDRPLDAIHFYERAIQLRWQDPKAYDQQLRVITQIFRGEGIRQLGPPHAWAPTLSRLDGLLKRDFGRLPQPLQGPHVEPIGWYWLQRQQFAEAERFLFPFVMDVDAQGLGRFRWWQIGPGLAYGEALLGQVSLGHALLRQQKLQDLKQLVADLRTALDRARRHHELAWETSETLQAKGQRLQSLDLRRHHAEQQYGRSPGQGAS